MNRKSTGSITTTSETSPFSPSNEVAYGRWRAAKLAAFPHDVEAIVVAVKDPNDLNQTERDAMLNACQRTNLCIYRANENTPISRSGVLDMGNKLGLSQLDNNLCADPDSVSLIEVSANNTRGEYVPYTDKALSWHTDGYYNAEDQMVQAWALHCVRSSAEGGVNQLLDHEIAFIRLRDANPDFITAMMQTDALTIPANIDNGKEIRPARTGPVFSINCKTGHLHMRYSARSRNIAWKDDACLLGARQLLDEILTTDPCRMEYTLQPGEGMLSNNVLHNRSAFTDDPQNPRLLYRARYHDRICTN